jgi:16S rRNA (cytosine1402-N4)-methyltransferase
MSLLHSLTSVRATRHLNREEDAVTHEQKSGHVSVMAREVVNYLLPKAKEVLLDATAGEGGTSEALLSHAKETKLIALDADPEAAKHTANRLLHYKERVQVIEGNFSDLQSILAVAGIEKVDKAVFDLGWNKGQLISGRGFSFVHDEPLIMSYGPKPLSGFTASQILNGWDEKVLADVFYGYGEERYARKIAKAVVERREIKPIETTLELVEIIRDAVPPSYRHGRISPATRSFQALRIAVNDELGAIERGLRSLWKHLSCEGRIVVISFHSIEDRLVKNLFKEFAKDSGKLLVKKPVIASREEVLNNPPSRSAKLRVIEKVCTH